MTDFVPFHGSNRGRILQLLRTRGPLTARFLSERLGISPDGVRRHLATLGRDGYVVQSDSRRTGGKPAAVFDLTAAAELLFPRHYREILAAVTDEAADLGFMADVGRRLAREANAPEETSAADRPRAAATALENLGASVDLEREGEGVHVIRGRTCPVAEIVTGRPGLCRMFAAMVSEITGLPVSELCVAGADRPRCILVIGEEAATSACVIPEAVDEILAKHGLLDAQYWG